jgi:hypothetical protein
MTERRCEPFRPIPSETPEKAVKEIVWVERHLHPVQLGPRWLRHPRRQPWRDPSLLLRLRDLLAAACRTSLLDQLALLLSRSCAIWQQVLTSPQAARISHALRSCPTPAAMPCNPAECLQTPQPPSRLLAGEGGADERRLAGRTLILRSTPATRRPPSGWSVRDPSQGRVRRLLPSPPPQKGAAWSTRLLHGVLRGLQVRWWRRLAILEARRSRRRPTCSRSGRLLPECICSERTALRQAVSPNGGRLKLDSKLGRNAAHWRHC